jgi:hypothetical protein
MIFLHRVVFLSEIPRNGGAVLEPRVAVKGKAQPQFIARPFTASTALLKPPE